MELTRTTKWLYWLLGLWIIFILTLGAWWTHLYLKFSEFSVVNSNPEQFYKVTRMLKWEGITVFFGLLALSLLIIYIFTRDLKKTNSLRSFFATMTHEMKTPLASIKLQAEALTDLLQDIDPKSYEKIKPFAERLVQDGHKLENEMDEILQLARLESGGGLNVQKLDLVEEFEKITFKYPELRFHIANSTEPIVMANQYALTLIFRNLIENTKRHQPHTKNINITIKKQNEFLYLTYDDNGLAFKGNFSKLGQLFYRFNSEKGSGLGLYLIHKLMNSQNGSLSITENNRLIFSLKFQVGENE